MITFKDNFSYTSPINTVFLCGVRFSKGNASDKRTILKRYVELNNPDTYGIILEEHFVFSKPRKKYLAYDEIYLYCLAQIEQLAALFVDSIIVIHESISTAAEIGLFASEPSLIPKMCMLIPDSMSVEEDKIGSFLRLSLANRKAPKSTVKSIVYYPDIEVHRLSVDTSKYLTYFHDNCIGTILGDKITEFVKRNDEKHIMRFTNSKFGKHSTAIDVIDYFFQNDGDQKLCISISADSLKVHIMSILFINEVRRELRKPKPIFEHVNFIEKKYTGILRDTVQKLSGLRTEGYPVSVALKATTCKLNQAIGLYLYILQAIDIICFEQKPGYNIDQRSIRIKDTLKKYKFLEDLLEQPKLTEFGRLNND